MLSPSEHYEEFGCEDPRVTEIDGTYYLTYTAWDRTNAQLCLATSTDLFTWEKHGPLFPDFNTFEPNAAEVPTPWSKAGAILATPIDGRYLMYFGEGSIYHAWSDDLIHWDAGAAGRAADAADADGHVRRVPRRGRPAADHHDNGLILLLHNAAVKFEDGTVRYSCGQLLFDPQRPDRDHGADELPVARALDVRGPARPRLQRHLRRGAGALPRHLVRLLRPERLDAGRGDVRGRCDVLGLV